MSEIQRKIKIYVIVYLSFLYFLETIMLLNKQVIKQMIREPGYFRN